MVYGFSPIFLILSIFDIVSILAIRILHSFWQRMEDKTSFEKMVHNPLLNSFKLDRQGFHSPTPTNIRLKKKLKQ